MISSFSPDGWWWSVRCVCLAVFFVKKRLKHQYFIRCKYYVIARFHVFLQYVSFAVHLIVFSKQPSVRLRNGHPITPALLFLGRGPRVFPRRSLRGSLAEFGTHTTDRVGHICDLSCPTRLPNVVEERKTWGCCVANPVSNQCLSRTWSVYLTQHTTL